MKYIDLPKPHGFLVWRQKQKAIASPVPLLAGEAVAIISEGEAFGEAVLANPIAVNLKEFERLQEEHCIRPEERKLYWPGVEAFFIHRLAGWQPYAETKAVCLRDGDCEFDELIEPTEAQKLLLNKAERLPKTVVLLDDAVVLEGDRAVISETLDGSKIKPVLDATFSETVGDDASLSLYQLALVRVPRLQLKKKEMEAEAMPYDKMMDHDDCDGVAVVKKGSMDMMGCHEDEEAANEQIAALLAEEEDKGKTGSNRRPGRSESRRKDLDDLDAQIAEIVERVLSERKWGETETSREEAKAEDAGYLVSGEGGNHLPTKKNGKLDHRLMGAAWAALHGGYRGNKYEGPGKAQAIAKLKKLYASEEMELPDSDEKAGRRMRGSMLEKLKNMMAMMQELLGWAEPEEEDDEMEGMPEGMMGMFNKKAGFAIKQVDGKPWMVTYSTNAFKDREKEIFSTKALEKYVAESEKSADRGTYNFWHIPNTDFACKEFQMVRGRFLIEAGPFLDNDLGQAALKFFEANPDGHKEIAPEGWGCSPEYRYLPEERKSGVYENIWITRTSVLPRLAAANIWTKGTIAMTEISKQQEEAAKKIFGEELAKTILSGADDATKELEEANIAHKGDSETQPEAPAPVVDVDAVAEALAARFETSFQPYTEALQLLGQQVAELQEQFKSFKKTEAAKEKVESPRFIFQMKRASEAAQTAVASDDPLSQMKPVETERKTDGSGASHFFPS